MNIENFAIFYVFYLQPALKVVAVVLAVVTILHLINLVFSGGKAFPVIEKIFNTMIKLILAVAVYSWKFINWITKVLLKTITVLFDTVRDFFTSKI